MPAMAVRGSIEEFPAGAKWESASFWVQISCRGLLLPAFAIGKCVNLELSIHGTSLKLPTLAVFNETALNQDQLVFRCNLPVHKFDPLVLKATIWHEKEVKIFATVVTLEQIVASYGQEVALTLGDGVSNEVVEFTCYQQLVTDAHIMEELVAASRRNSVNAAPGGGSQPANDFEKKFTPTPLRPLRGPVDFLHAVTNGQEGTAAEEPSGAGPVGNIIKSLVSSPILKLTGCFVLMSLLMK